MLPYFCMPSWVLALLKGKPYPFFILSTLCCNRSIETNNTKFISIPEVGKLTGVSQREAYNAIEVLKDLNLIDELKNIKGQRMFHLPFLNDDTVTKEEVLEQAESLEAQWEAHLKEVGLAEAEEEDENLKSQLQDLGGENKC